MPAIRSDPPSLNLTKEALAALGLLSGLPPGAYSPQDQALASNPATSLGSIVSLASAGTTIGGGLIYLPPSNDTSGATDSANFQALAAGAIIILTKGATYYLNVHTTFTGDLTVWAYGATLKWITAGGTEDIMFVNSSAINLRWLGGTIDCNGINDTVWGFGGAGSANHASTFLKSCFVADLHFINVFHGAWSCAPPGTTPNQNVRWINVSAAKVNTGDSADMFELVANNAQVDVWGVPNGTTAYLFTSAYLKHAEISVYVCDATGLSTDENSVLLQPTTGNGTAPFFTDVVVRCNGNAGAQNGALGSPTTVSQQIVWELRSATRLTLGSSANDVWDQFVVRGTMRPNASGIGIGSVNETTLDLVVDGSRASAQVGLVYITGSLAPVNVDVERLVLVAPASAWTAIFNSFGGTATRLTIRGGDVSRANLATNPLLGGSGSWGTTIVRNLTGYNPVGVVSPAVPSSGVAVAAQPYDRTFYVSTVVGTTTCSMAIQGGPTITFIGATAQVVAVKVPAGQTVTPTYTGTAPTWTVEGE